jgi:hypothetical protein
MDSFAPYEYRLQARRPGTYAALAFGMGMAQVNRFLDAPFLAWALVAAFLVLTLVALVLNHAAGVRLSADRIEIYTGAAERSVALAQIERAVLAGNPFGPRRCTLHLYNGTRLVLPAESLPPLRRFAQALMRHGVPTELAAPRAALPLPAFA